MLAEVVGFAGDKAFLMPAGDIQGLSCGATVTPAEPFVSPLRFGDTEAPSLAKGLLRLPMGNGLLGRVVDSQGFPLDRRRHGRARRLVTADAVGVKPERRGEAPRRPGHRTGLRQPRGWPHPGIR